ncbi:hypothetical protein C4O09_005083 [Salmonella enterica subsp. enterica serovar Minnesota]|nr:hypothetical protein [Salmonella enterica subsp. enterica serovar Minnesota]
MKKKNKTSGTNWSCFVNEINALRRSRNFVVDILEEYPEINNQPVRSVIITEDDLMKMKDFLPEHHFLWLQKNETDIVTVGKLDDFFTVADEFSLLVEERFPDLEEKEDYITIHF